MKNLQCNIFLLSSLFTGTCVLAKHDEAKQDESRWSWHVGAGYGWTRKTGIVNPDTSLWDAATEGYDEDLDSTKIVQLGVDRLFNVNCGFDCKISLGAEVNIVNDMQYQKHQTGTPTNVGGTGSRRMRFFNLGHASFMVRGRFIPMEWENDYVAITPVLEAGLGVAANRVYNFHTVGYKSTTINGSTFGAGSTTSVGNDHKRRAGLAWQTGFGFELRPERYQSTAVKVGYRYYEGGKFKTPDKMMLNTDGASEQGQLFDTSAALWEGKLKMHQLLVSIEVEF